MRSSQEYESTSLGAARMAKALRSRLCLATRLTFLKAIPAALIAGCMLDLLAFDHADLETD